jgi:hypothetical protein
MLTYYIEHDNLKARLERVEISSIREIVDPIRDHLDRRLSILGLNDDLTIIFVIDEDGKLSVNFRGEPLSVNLARDILGERDRVGQIPS